MPRVMKMLAFRRMPATRGANVADSLNNAVCG